MWYPFQTALESILCLFHSPSIPVEPARVEEVAEGNGGETAPSETQSSQPVETSGVTTPTPTPNEATKEVEQPETWEESFKGHMDSRPNGKRLWDKADHLCGSLSLGQKTCCYSIVKRGRCLLVC